MMTARTWKVGAGLLALVTVLVLCTANLATATRPLQVDSLRALQSGAGHTNSRLEKFKERVKAKELAVEGEEPEALDEEDSLETDETAGAGAGAAAVEEGEEELEEVEEEEEVETIEEAEAVEEGEPEQYIDEEDEPGEEPNHQLEEEAEEETEEVELVNEHGDDIEDEGVEEAVPEEDLDHDWVSDVDAANHDIDEYEEASRR